jgi:hypothetical protein
MIKIVSKHKRLRGVATALALAAVAASPAAGGVPQGSFPSSPSPRDEPVTLLVSDTSCDQFRESPAQLRDVIYGLVTNVAWREGTFGLATMRSDALLNLNFHYVRFRSQMQSPEAIRRDLQQQRNDAPVARFAQDVVRGRSGPCRTDMTSALLQIQRELSSIGAGGHLVTVVVITNGIVLADDLNFLRESRAPTVVVHELAAKDDIAHLPRVQLVFVGVGRAVGVTPTRQRWLEDFWAAYARVAGSTPVFIRTTGDLAVRVGGAS